MVETARGSGESEVWEGSRVGVRGIERGQDHIEIYPGLYLDSGDSPRKLKEAIYRQEGKLNCLCPPCSFVFPVSFFAFG